MTTMYQPGDKVRTQYGDIETVRLVNGCQVFTYESLLSWYHPAKLTKI